MLIYILAAVMITGAVQKSQETAYVVEEIATVDEAEYRDDCYHQNLKLYCPSEDKEISDVFYK